MATGAYVGVSNSTRALKSIYIGSGSVAHKVKRAYIGVSNLAKLWWKSELSFTKTISLPPYEFLIDQTYFGFYFCNNGSYLMGVSRDSAFYVDRNDVVGTIQNRGNVCGLVSSSGSKVWYLDFNGTHFCYYDTNLVSNTITSSIGVQVDYNSNFGGGSYSYKDLGIATFFEFYYPRYILCRLYENGVMNNIKDAFDGIGGGSYRRYVKIGNYILYIKSSNNSSGLAPAVNVSTGVVTTNVDTDDCAFACARCEDIDGVAIIISGSPANSVTKAHAINKNLVVTPFAVPSPYGSLHGVYYDCVSYNRTFTYYSHYSYEKPAFSIDLNYIFNDSEHPRDVDPLYSYISGHDVFNGSVYLASYGNNYLTGLIKGN